VIGSVTFPDEKGNNPSRHATSREHSLQRKCWLKLFAIGIGKSRRSDKFDSISYQQFTDATPSVFMLGPQMPLKERREKEMLKTGFPSILVLAGVLCWLSPSVLAEDLSIRWFDDFNAGVQYANSQQFPIMLHFYGESCPPCKMLEKRAYKNPELVGKINNQMVAIRINGDRQKELRDRYQIRSWPTDVYLTPTGKELYRTTSPQDPAVYAQIVDRVSLQCADWNVEQMAARQSQNHRLANRTATQTIQSGQSPIAPTLTGPAPHPVVTQSRIAGLPPTTNQSPTDLKQRRIDNPYVASGPVVVPPAQTHASNQLFSNVAEQPIRRVAPNAGPSHPGPDRTPSLETSPSGSSVPVASRPVAAQPIAANLGNSAPNFNLDPRMASQATQPEQRVSVQSQGLSGSEKISSAQLGLGGFCPVTLVMAGRNKSVDCWVEGKPEFAVRHRGRVYLCSSEQARQLFLKEPDSYAPALSNYDLIHFVKTGQLIDGRCEFGSFQPTTGKVFLFANQQNCDEFQQWEAYYSEILQRSESPERVAVKPGPSQVR
jgi:thiol-disulfide isomerase/thioredoxin/YHS domain-containing protein